MVAMMSNTNGQGTRGLSTLARLADANDELVKLSGTDPCGHLCWQQVPGDVMIDHTKLDDLCDAAGLPAEHRLREVRRRTAFKRAMKDLKRLLPKGHEPRIVNDGENEVVYEVVEVIGGEKAKQNSYTFKETLALDLITGVVTSEQCAPGWTSVQHHALAGFLKHRSHNATDLRNMVLVFLRKKGVMLSNGSGIYFVPHAPAIVKVLDAMQTVLADPSIAGGVAALAQASTEATRKVIHGSVQAGIEEEIRQIEHRLDAIDTDKLRDTTFGKKVKELDELKGKAKLFADVLKFKSETLEQRLNSVVAKFKARVEGTLELPKAEPQQAVAEVVEQAREGVPAEAFDSVPQQQATGEPSLADIAAAAAANPEPPAPVEAPEPTPEDSGLSAEAHQAALDLLKEAGVTPGADIAAFDDDCGF